MTDLEIKSAHLSDYEYFVSLLEIYKRDHPESYNLAAEMGEKFRGYVKRIAQIDDLLPVPKL